MNTKIVAYIISYISLNNSFHLSHHEQYFPFPLPLKPAHICNANPKGQSMFLPHLHQNVYKPTKKNQRKPFSMGLFGGKRCTCILCVLAQMITSTHSSLPHPCCAHHDIRAPFPVLAICCCHHCFVLLRPTNPNWDHLCDRGFGTMHWRSVGSSALYSVQFCHWPDMPV